MQSNASGGSGASGGYGGGSGIVIIKTNQAIGGPIVGARGGYFIN